MTGGEALRAAGMDGAELRALLHPIDPDTVPLRPAPRWLRAIWGSDVRAVALGRTVFVRPDQFSADPKILGRLIVHELVHIRQWSDYGTMGFAARYLRRYLAGIARGLGHRAAYRANPYETEAREAADEFGRIV